MSNGSIERGPSVENRSEDDGAGFIAREKTQIEAVADEIGIRWALGDPGIIKFLEQAAMIGRERSEGGQDA